MDLGLRIDSYISDKLKGNEANDIDDWPAPIVKLKIHVNMFTYSLSLFWIIFKTLENWRGWILEGFWANLIRIVLQTSIDNIKHLWDFIFNKRCLWCLVHIPSSFIFAYVFEKISSIYKTIWKSLKYTLNNIFVFEKMHSLNNATTLHQVKFHIIKIMTPK